MNKKNIFFNIKTTIFVGFLGGLIFSAYDIVITIIKFRYIIDNGYLTIILWPMLLWSLLWITVMIIFGNISFFLATLNNIRLSKKEIVCLQVGTFVFLAVLVTTTYYIDSITLGWTLFWWDTLYRIVTFTLLSVLSGFGAAMFIHSLIKKYTTQQLVLRGLIIIIIIIAVGVGFYIFIKVSLFANNTNLDSLLQNKTQASNQYPNILWIVMDTVRADHLPCYGYERNTMPNVCALASEGVLYKNTVSAAPWTLPSHAAMFTGMYPSAHGATGAWPWLDDNQKTIAEVLKEVGYTTAGFSNNRAASPETNINQGFNIFYTIDKWGLRGREFLLARFLARTAEFFWISNVHRWVLQINNLLAQEDSGAKKTNQIIQTFLAKEKYPFFIFVNYIEAHDPYGDSKQKDTKTNKDYWQRMVYQQDFLKNFKQYFAGKKTVSQEYSQTAINFYDNDLAYLDTKVNELIEILRDKNILDNTLIIITSDHGENFGENNKVQHLYDIHRTLTHVPLIIRYPKLFTPKTIIENTVQLVDIFPTVLDVLKLDYSEKNKLQGYSLFDKERPDMAITETLWMTRFQDISDTTKYFPGTDPRKLGGVWRSIQSGGYEYIYSTTEQHLYNLVTDPEEKNDLLNKEPHKAKEMRQMLVNWLGSFKHYWDP